MPDILTLIGSAKYAEAARLIDSALAKKKDAPLYYLRALVSYKLKNYDYAEEMLEHALSLKKEPHYLRLKALVLMETLEFEEAFGVLETLVEQKKDAEAYFLAAVCLIFAGDPRSRDYLQLAYMADRAKTKTLISVFYSKFFQSNPFLGEKEKKALEEKIRRIK